jgi:hypothetical protein
VVGEGPLGHREECVCFCSVQEFQHSLSAPSKPPHAGCCLPFFFPTMEKEVCHLQTSHNANHTTVKRTHRTRARPHRVQRREWGRLWGPAGRPPQAPQSMLPSGARHTQQSGTSAGAPLKEGCCTCATCAPGGGGCSLQQCPCNLPRNNEPTQEWRNSREGTAQCS